jgi:hypothetical protein
MRLCAIALSYLPLAALVFTTGQPSVLAASSFENRCGWFSNPTPSNAWLDDADGNWLIARQGGYQAKGNWPDFKPQQWVVTNAGSYGYGCACLRVKVDRQSRRVIEIKSSYSQSLAICRKDRSLQEPQ